MSYKNPSQTPSLIFANQQGEIKDFPELAMAGRSGTEFVEPLPDDLIPLPPGSDLFVLPDRQPVGFDRRNGELLLLDQNPDKPNEGIQAVAAFMSPAYTAIHSTAFKKSRPDLDHLPLFAYTAVGWYKGKFWVSALRSDPDCRQDVDRFNHEKIRAKTTNKLKKFPKNRLIQHLGKCCLTYGCPAARNFFLGRWEAPLPCSPTCNAQCLGCISLQPSGCCPATQDRITFVPSPEEIAEIAVPHLNKAQRSVVSFGQGCEGEPLTQARTIEQAIKKIRGATNRGTVNLNSNGSLPDKVERLAAAGLDSIRVSINSARPEYHERYYRPRGFDFNDVVQSISMMKKAGRFVSLNYFILPGFTDDPEEFTALCELIRTRRPDLIQLRNLNIDPDWYLEVVKHRPATPALGIRNWLRKLKKMFPELRYGYFNPPLR